MEQDLLVIRHASANLAMMPRPEQQTQLVMGPDNYCMVCYQFCNGKTGYSRYDMGQRAKWLLDA